MSPVAPSKNGDGHDGFVMLPDSFILDDMGPLHDRAVKALLVLLQHADENRQAYPSLKRIAKLMGGVSKYTARRAINDLIDAELVEREERHGESYLYTISPQVCLRGGKSATPSQTGGGKSATGTGCKSASGGGANLQHEPYPKNHTQLNQKECGSAFVFPTKSGEWTLLPSDLEEYRATYPSIDIDAEMRKARLWCSTNPGKRKTTSGMPRFLANWLSGAKPQGNGRSETMTLEI